MKKIIVIMILAGISIKSYSQDINFSSEYNRVSWPVALGLSGGVTGDDGSYKRLALYHGGSISLQTGSNSPGIANSRVFIDNTGHVGIGTTSPSSKLVISDGGNNAISINPGAGANSLGFNRNAFDGVIFNPSISAWQFSARDGIFSLEGYNGAYSSPFNVLKNGYIGIGTTTPATKLEVHGTTAIGQYTNGTAVIDAFNSYAYFGCNTATNGISVGPSGNVGIGTTAPDAKLAVNGQVHATEVKVTTTVPGPDYVFEPTYILPTLEAVKTYIDENKHLPEVPSAKEMEANGVKLGEMNMLLLKKIEELTLYVIELKKENTDLRSQKGEIDKIEEELEVIKKVISNKQ